MQYTKEQYIEMMSQRILNEGIRSILGEIYDAKFHHNPNEALARDAFTAGRDVLKRHFPSIEEKELMWAEFERWWKLHGIYAANT